MNPEKLAKLQAQAAANRIGEHPADVVFPARDADDRNGVKRRQGYRTSQDRTKNEACGSPGRQEAPGSLEEA